MTSSATGRKARFDPTDRLTPTERNRYQEAADLIQSWLDEAPDYDRETWKDLRRRLPRLRTRVREGATKP